MQPIEDFAIQFPQRKYPVGTQLFRDESQPTFFFYVVEGAIQMSQTDESGKVIHLHLFYPGACLPLLSLVEPGNIYDYTVVADLIVHQIPRKEFFAEARTNPEFTLTLLTHAMKGMKGLLYRVQQAASASAYQRVAGLLVYFSRHSSTEKKAKSSVTITHQQISEWLGLTRENVSLQLKKLEEEQMIIRHQRSIEILDVKKLLVTSQ